MTNSREIVDASSAISTPKHILRGLLMPAALTYGCGSLVRMVAYATGVMPRYKAPVPVVSIGNLTVGGTGKTPLAIDLATKFVAAGFRPAVLSRGYRRKSTDEYLIVSDGKTILTTCEDAGDEPFLIASSVKGAVVIVGARRAQTAEVACSQLGCNILLLDDGFQHLKITRDADVVLIDYNDDLENDLLLPAGRLREPLAALNRASSVVITKVPAVPDHAKLEKLSAIVHKHNHGATIALCRFVPTRLVGFDDSGSVPALVTRSALAAVPGKVIAFCGLARPERFFSELPGDKFTVVEKVSLPDHHWYTAGDASRLNALARKHDAEGFVTTEKDMVKFFDLRRQLERPLLAVGLNTEWIGALPDAVQELLSKGPK